MTIQFLAQWNGNEAFSIKSLAASEETRLVAAGIARVYTDAMDGGSGGAAVVYRKTGALDDASRAALAYSQVQTNLAMVNWKRSNTLQIRAALAGAASNDFRSRFLFVPDSMMAGTQSANNGLVGARAKGWIRQLAAMLTAAGYQADENWSMGTGGNGTLATISTYDPRITFGSATTLNGAYPGMAGGHWATGTDAVNGWVKHTAIKAFDTVDLLYMRATGTGSLKVQDQAATVVNAAFSTTGGNSAQEASFTFAANSTAAQFTTTGTNCMIAGIGTRNAASPGIEMLNAGISGINLAYETVNPATGNNFAGPQIAMPALLGSSTKNVVFTGGGYNDINSFGQTLEQTKTILRNHLTFLKSIASAPDIVWMGYPRFATGPGGMDPDLFADSLQNIAVNEFDIPAIDQRKVQEPAATAIALGLMNADGLHYRAGGQANMAKMVFDALMFSRSMGY